MKNIPKLKNFNPTPINIIIRPITKLIQKTNIASENKTETKLTRELSKNEKKRQFLRKVRR